MHIASLSNLFSGDMLIIFLVVLLLFGAKKLPELAKGMGQAVREFTRAKDDIEREVTRPPEPEPPKRLAEPDLVAENETKPEAAKETEPHESTRAG